MDNFESKLILLRLIKNGIKYSISRSEFKQNPYFAIQVMKEKLCVELDLTDRVLIAKEIETLKNNKIKWLLKKGE
jgi:hypothetical protein